MPQASPELPTCVRDDMIAMVVSYFESRLAKQYIKDVFMHCVLANT